MPPLIAGMDRKQLMIYGGLGAVGVAAVVYLRMKAAQSAPDMSAPQPQDSGGGGGGTMVAAPSQPIADQYQAGMSQAQIDAANLQNAYGQEQLRQSKAAFDLQQTLAAGEAALMAPAEKAYAGLIGAQYGAEANYYNQLATRQVSCPGNASVRIDPSTGQAYCRQKTSGGILGIPVGQIVDAISGFVGGVQQVAPQIGAGTAQAAASYYTRRLFSTKPQQAQGQYGAPQQFAALPAMQQFGGHF